MTLSEWKDFATIMGSVVAFAGAGFAIYKGLSELQKTREQRDRELKLKRVEFTLAQHRRLFDDPVLYRVLIALDGDQAALAEPDMADPKRKFLTFIEELCLLMNEGLVNKDVGHYMFGYYAAAAYNGVNFKAGLAWEPKYWGLFFDFAQEANKRLQHAPSPSQLLALRF